MLFVLIVLAHHRQRVVHFNVTEHPTAHWTAQQIVQFRYRVKGMRIDEVLTTPHSPWQNPFAERLIGSV